MRLESPSRRRTTIGLTSLIDVVFILLLFFMLTTQFGRQQAMRLALPTSDAATVRSNDQRLFLALAADGTLSLAGEQGVDPDGLATHPAIGSARANGTPVTVIADDDVELRTFTRLMDVVARLGLTDVSVGGLR